MQKPVTLKECLKTCPEIDTQPCKTFPFGEVASYFNALYIGSVFASAGEVKGRLGTCGSVVLGVGFTIGDEISGRSVLDDKYNSSDVSAFPYSLVALESVEFPNGLVHNGGVWCGNDKQCHVGSTVSNSLTANGFSIKAGGGNDISQACSALAGELNALSQALVNLDVTVQFGRANSLYYVYLPQLTQVVVAKFSYVDLAQSMQFVFVQTVAVPPVTPTSKPQVFLFNVGGIDVQFGPLDMEILAPYASRIIWNFYEAKTLRILQTVVYGTILAPQATVVSSSTGEIHGQVFAFAFANSTEQGSLFQYSSDPQLSYIASYVGQTTIFDVPFKGCLPLKVNYPGGAAPTSNAGVSVPATSVVTSNVVLGTENVGPTTVNSSYAQNEKSIATRHPFKSALALTFALALCFLLS